MRANQDISWTETIQLKRQLVKLSIKQASALILLVKNLKIDTKQWPPPSPCPALRKLAVKAICRVVCSQHLVGKSDLWLFYLLGGIGLR
jgi:hypothetical protein